MSKRSINLTMRILHRYVGYFILGLVIIYSLAGITLIFRDTGFMKNEKLVTTDLAVDTNPELLGNILGIRGFKITERDGNLVKFNGGNFNLKTGETLYTIKEYNFLAEKITNLHKTPSKNAMHWITLTFGILLLFLAISSLWMFKIKTKIFKKAIITVFAGVLIAIVLLILV